MTTPQNFVYKLSDHLQKIINKFQTDYSLIPCIGVEIEFYLSKNVNPLELQTLLGIVVKKEKGNNQFEIDLPPSTNNIIEYIGKISSTKSKIQIITKKLRGKVNFSAKPFPNDYGSSMHFHVNFIDSSALMNSVANPNIIYSFVPTEKMSFPCRRESSVGCHSRESKNLDTCLRRDGTDMLDLMGQSICHYMLDSFLIFMPNERTFGELCQYRISYFKIQPIREENI
ncbi:hypothetical protein [Candidatus Tisiphia endosymbiont of Micropterix aruncella]|uniref:hypothetical protein n=1 Tax=Candidatus Tisiphia endosymbiont of Micropterix aruncella TaxID=3066271 RepID=UPI003AA9A6B9